MREWFYVIGPVAIVLYFLAFPDQLGATVGWLVATADWVLGTV